MFHSSSYFQLKPARFVFHESRFGKVYADVRTGAFPEYVRYMRQGTGGTLRPPTRREFRAQLLGPAEPGTYEAAFNEAVLEMPERYQREFQDKLRALVAK